MKKERLYIPNKDALIPSVLWGEGSEELLIEVHGNLSNKEDTVISMMAQKAVEKGYQALSFDLPGHGERVNEKNYACDPQNCVSDLRAVWAYVAAASDISLFACSMGAYFSLLAYRDYTVRKSLFLSPVVNMERIIENMMAAFSVSEERLKEERIIPLPSGQTLDWDYYSYVKKNPVSFVWKVPTSILYGEDDNVSEWGDVSRFAETSGASLRVLVHGEHYFHTEEQLRAFDAWAAEYLP
jgi:alpha-beta hydrolase superfamily lysophospholipase